MFVVKILNVIMKNTPLFFIEKKYLQKLLTVCQLKSEFTYVAGIYMY